MSDYTIRLIIEAVDNTKAAEKIGGVNKALGDMARIAGGILSARAMSAATTGLTDVALSGVKVESAFAGVTKTVDGLLNEQGKLNEQGTILKQGFRDLAQTIPISIEELMRIGELGGQLGVAKDDLLNFTNVIAAMGVTTDLTSEEAATSMAQWMNIMQTGGEDVERLGSVIVALGNSSAATERDIAAFGLRISGAGSIAGLTEANVAAIGTAMASVGVEAEAGGTAVQKVLLAMNESAAGYKQAMENIAELPPDASPEEIGEAWNKPALMLQSFADAAGMSADDFVKSWDTKPMEAFTAFVEGLGKAGDDAFGILESVKLEDQRLMRAFLSLGNAGTVLSDAVTIGNAAWDESSALAKEAGTRYGTTESQFAIASNQLRDIGVSISDSLLPGFHKIMETVGPMAEEMAKLTPVLTTQSELWAGMGGSLGGFLALPLVTQLEAATSTMKLLNEAVTTFKDLLGLSGEGTDKAATDVSVLGQTLGLVGKIFGAFVGGPMVMMKTALEGIINMIEQFKALPENIRKAGDEVGPLWNTISTTISDGWNNTVKPILDAFARGWEGIGSAIDAVKDRLQPLIDKFNEFGSKIPSWLIPHSPTPFEMGLRGIASALGVVRSNMAGMISPAAMSRLSNAYGNLIAMQKTRFSGTNDLHGHTAKGLSDIGLQVQSMGLLGDLQRNVLGAFMPGFNAANAGIASGQQKVTQEWTGGGAKTYASLTDISKILGGLAQNKYGTLPSLAISAMRTAAGDMKALLRAYNLNDVTRWQFRDQGKLIAAGLERSLKRLNLSELNPLLAVLAGWRGEANRTYREGQGVGDEARSSGPGRTSEQEQRDRENMERERRYGNPLTARLARGADFIVPPGYSGDRYGPLWVNSGEHVKVTPAGQAGGGNAYTLNMYPASVTPETVVSGFYMLKSLARAKA